MAKRKPNGEFSGLIGNLISYQVKGQNRIRMKSRTRVDTSELVAEARSDFRVVMNLLKNAKSFINIGFKDHTDNRSAYHSALSINLKNYKEAQRLGKTDNYGWFVLSDGKLSGAENINATKLEDGTIELTWEGAEPGRPFNAKDNAIGYAYLNTSDRFMKGAENVTRSDGKMTIQPGMLKEGEKIDVFLSFTVPNGAYKAKSSKNVSTSQWAGSV